MLTTALRILRHVNAASTRRQSAFPGPKSDSCSSTGKPKGLGEVAGGVRPAWGGGAEDSGLDWETGSTRDPYGHLTTYHLRWHVLTKGRGPPSLQGWASTRSEQPALPPHPHPHPRQGTDLCGSRTTCCAGVPTPSRPAVWSRRREDKAAVTPRPVKRDRAARPPPCVHLSPSAICARQPPHPRLRPAAQR